MGPMNLPDLRPVFILAFIGIASIAIAVISALVWLCYHIRFV